MLHHNNSNEAVILKQNKDMTTFTIRDREAGNFIEGGLSGKEAEIKVKEFEDEDKSNDILVEDFYEIVEENA